MTVHRELELQEDARRYVVGWLSNHQGLSDSDEILSSSATTGRPIPVYAIKRALWSLVADGKAEITPNNKVRLLSR